MAHASDLKTGHIVTHAFRKEAVYVIVKDVKGFHMIRVRKHDGYSIASEGRYLERDATKLTIYDFCEHWKDLTMKDRRTLRGYQGF